MDQAWETTADIEQAFEVAGLTFSPRKLERWREKKLLYGAKQLIEPYNGSETRHPIGTAARAVAIEQLLNEKRKFDYVGRELWWRGSNDVDERYWKPTLIEVAKGGDRVLAILGKMLVRDGREISQDTIADRAANSATSDSIFLKLKRRLEPDQRAPIVGLMLDVANGQFDGFIPEDMESKFHKALDVDQSTHDQVNGKRLHLVPALIEFLREITHIRQKCSLAALIDYPEEEIERARDNVRYALQITIDLYENTSWIYGQNAFGLRFAAWVAKHFTPTMKAFAVLIFAALRRHSHYFISHEEIKALAADAAELHALSLQLQALRNDPRFSKVLSPKKLKLGFSGKDEMWSHLKEIEKARLGN